MNNSFLTPYVQINKRKSLNIQTYFLHRNKYTKITVNDKQKQKKITLKPLPKDQIMISILKDKKSKKKTTNK